MPPRTQFAVPFCRWTCPLCETTTVCVRADEGCLSVTNNLRTHIRATTDSAHGPLGEYPAEVDQLDLDSCVTCEP